MRNLKLLLTTQKRLQNFENFDENDAFISIDSLSQTTFIGHGVKFVAFDAKLEEENVL